MDKKLELLIGVKFPIKVKKEGKYFVASCDKIGKVGIASQGSTKQEAIENLNEAIALYLEDEHAVKSNLPKIKINILLTKENNKVINLEPVASVR